jgi:hypothetical protein
VKSGIRVRLEVSGDFPVDGMLDLIEFAKRGVRHRHGIVEAVADRNREIALKLRDACVDDAR